MRAREEIELALIVAGWEVTGCSSPRLIAANAGGVPLSIRAYGPFIGDSDEPVFELVDRLLELTYWVREVPTPRVALALIREHGGPPGMERGKPYRRAQGLIIGPDATFVYGCIPTIVNAGSAVSDKVFSETVWKIVGRLLDPGLGYTTAVIKKVDPEKMRTFIQRVPTSNAGNLSKQSI